jgi:prephenate dehydrogenase
VRFKKITIIGVGLIGGSIGLAIKKRRLAKEVVGVFRRPSTLKRALKAKAIDKGTLDIKEGVKGANLIILAGPVSAIPALAKAAIRYAKPDAVITDVGSTKAWIVKKIETYASGRPIHFVGSHPMAGSEQTGVEFAASELLKDAPCIVTRTGRTARRAIKTVIDFWRDLGAKVTVMSPSDHDRSVALISHLPHIVAFSLAGAVPAKFLRYGAEGFKDTTRVASSDPNLWAGIFTTNKREVARSGRLFERHLRKLLNAVSKGDNRKVAAILSGAKAKRDKFTYGN